MTQENYSHGHHPSVIQSHSWRSVDNSASYLADMFVPGTSVLDVGCGPGTITLDIAERVAPGRVVGLDSSAEIVAQAAARAQELRITNVEFVVGDAYALNFPNESFDVVHAHQVLHHVTRPVDVLTEMRRVRTREGVVGVREVVYGGTLWDPESSGLEHWLKTLMQVLDRNGGNPDAGRNLKSWALEAGFANVTADASIWCFSSNEARDWWGSAWSDRALHSQFANDAVEGGFATTEDLQLMSDAWLRFVQRADGWFAMPHGEILARD
ncbi:class I SAM-dependent methyltransferase [Cryobacterium sp. TMT2-15-1]|uniref:class I SAM-dependent methyltransferase n=1 Tax=Cryobacterium sp. TMT2-15-1 TaxID=1259246 RepID=UPI00106A8775|nr:class I SAM-dependent methyltransferase [Cryobacterium sp. TMT2-15-1]TFC55453.1 class I SAM-dependent methyltransferase [Cryobacterium sp. TMT2-15-1]